MHGTFASRLLVCILHWIGCGSKSLPSDGSLVTYGGGVVVSLATIKPPTRLAPVTCLLPIAP